MNNAEGTHYKKRKKESGKEFYSLREMVVEITGINEEDKIFDAKYKEIQRIIRAFRKSLGQKGSRMKIASSEKNILVEATKNFYNNEEAREIIRKLDKEERLTIEEHDVLINIFVEVMLKYSTEDEKKKLEQFVKEMKDDEFFDKGEIIKKEVIEDMFLVDEIKHYETKLKYLDEYKKILDDALKTWRNDISMHIKHDKAYERLVQKRPECLLDEPLSDKNMTPEILVGIMNEIILMDLEDKK